MENSESPFRFDDPRQERVHRRLLLVGPGPASFYRDACRLMEGSNLDSTTHLVAHLLREIESSLRDVLESLIDRAEGIRRRDEGSTQERHANEIRAVLRALNIAETDPTAQIWLRLSGRANDYGLHMRAHRSALFPPRRLDDEFETFWNDFNRILEEVLDRFESRYLDSHHILDELLNQKSPKRADVDKLRNRVPNNLVSFRYFFEKLNSPEWLEPLDQAGFFKESPEPERDAEAGTVGYPMWPQSAYLARMASRDTTSVKEAVLRIALAIEDHGNVRVQEDLIDIALALPPERAEAFVPKSTQWVGTLHLWMLDKLVDFVCHLAHGGRIEGALALAEALFAVRVERRTAIKLSEDETYEPQGRLDSHFALWEYNEGLKKVIPELISTGRVKALSWICDLLEAALRLSLNAKEGETKSDYSTVWRPAIEDHEQNHLMDVRDALVTAVRDAALNLAGLEPERLHSLIESLESRNWPVFRRVALHLLSVFPDWSPQLVAERLTNQQIFNKADLRHEYVSLLRACFSRLHPEDKAKILRYVETGPPYLDRVRAEHEKRTGEAMSEIDAAAVVGHWQRDRLAPISESLQDNWQGRYTKLVHEFGQAEHPDFLSYSSGGSVGPTSPKSEDELRSLSVAEIAEFLRSWRPSASSLGLVEAPSREGFARVLTEVVKADPIPFAIQATHFQGLDATYIRGLLHGLEQAVRENRCFSWKPVIDLMQWVVAQPREIPGRAPGHWQDSDPDWGWTRREIAGLLSRGLASGPCEIAFEARHSIWEVLKPLTDDPEPSPDYEAKYGGSNMDAATLSINTVRAEAMSAVLAYGLWVRRRIETMPDRNERVRRGFEEAPELREILEHHLNPDIDGSVAVRAVYGRSFPWLVSIDSDWTARNVQRIFPTEEGFRILRDAAWHTYVTFCRPYDNILALLREEYGRAIDRIGQPQSGSWHLGSPDEHLTQHLMVFYARGKLNLETGDLLDRFYSRASDQLRGHAIDFIGRMLCNSEDLPNELIARLGVLWARRLEIAASAPGASAEFVGFGYWFISEKFDSAWALDQLVNALRIARSVKPEHKVIERLSTLSPEKPVETIQCLRLMIEGDRQGWEVMGWRKEIRQILSIALQGENEAGRRDAIELIHRLGAMGYLEFADLLPSP